MPHFPDEDAKLRANDIQVRRGGNCPNTLEVLQQLLRSDHDRRHRRGARRQPEAPLPPQPTRVRPHLVSCLPSQSAQATKTILSSFVDPGSPDTVAAEQVRDGAQDVSFEHCLYREGHGEAASSCIIRSQATGSRTIVNYNDLPEMTAGEFVEIALRAAAAAATTTTSSSSTLMTTSGGARHDDKRSSGTSSDGPAGVHMQGAGARLGPTTHAPTAAGDAPSGVSLDESLWIGPAMPGALLLPGT